MIVYERAVRFHEIDAAGMVFFPSYCVWAHEAMEQFFDELEGGYARLVSERRTGLPAVKLEVSYHRPLSFGDSIRIESSVQRLGSRSMTFRHRFVRVGDELPCAEMLHTVVTIDLDARESREMPADVRRQAERHLEADGRT